MCSLFAAEKSHLLRWDIDAFWRMVYSSPSLTQQILNSMARLLKSLETVLEHNQKLIALGSLAAGLAHELNNPAGLLIDLSRNCLILFQNGDL